jgi:imidazolonepropionase-like amidohydrolase
LKADSIEAAGKTLVPGLIDARVELTAPGGLYDPPRSFRPGLAARRALAAYLYCGATAVRSVEDAPGLVEPLGNAVASGEYLGAEVLTKPRRAGDAYTPALSVLEGQADLGAGDSELLNGTLVEQVGPLELIRGTRKALASHSPGHPDDAAVRAAAGRLMNAYRAGALLVAGSGAGSTLVFHGPSVQRELELWVKAGIPPREALQAATSNAARWLGVDARIGAIRAGNDADLLLVDGNPLEDITALERVSEVIFKGERVDRAALFEGE